MTRLPALLQLVSPQLPIGGFAYSRGLETAVERGWVTDAAQTEAWIEGLLLGTATHVDAALAARFHAAWAADDRRAIARWAALERALRETHELERESAAMGSALARLLGELGTAPEDLALARPCFLAAFALAARGWGLSPRETLFAVLWTWLEASVMAAVKLVPLGQTDGQRMLQRLGARLEAQVDVALALPDEDVGAIHPGLAIACSLHETQHTRLFRS